MPVTGGLIGLEKKCLTFAVRQKLHATALFWAPLAMYMNIRFFCYVLKSITKKWMFADQLIGAYAYTSALIYSLVGTANLNEIKPYSYLRYVLEKMSSFLRLITLVNLLLKN